MVPCIKTDEVRYDIMSWNVKRNLKLGIPN